MRRCALCSPRRDGSLDETECDIWNSTSWSGGPRPLPRPPAAPAGCRGHVTEKKGQCPWQDDGGAVVLITSLERGKTTKSPSQPASSHTLLTQRVEAAGPPTPPGRGARLSRGHVKTEAGNPAPPRPATLSARSNDDVDRVLMAKMEMKEISPEL